MVEKNYCVAIVLEIIEEIAFIFTHKFDFVAFIDVFCQKETRKKKIENVKAI